MILDVDASFKVWREQQLQKRPDSNPKVSDYLRELRMSRQTYHNLQNGKGKQKPFLYAQKIKDLTGISLDKLIKPLKKDGN